MTVSDPEVGEVLLYEGPETPEPFGIECEHPGDGQPWIVTVARASIIARSTSPDSAVP